MKAPKTLLALLIGSLAFISGCSKQEETAAQTSQAAKVIKVAVSPASPPMLFEEKGEIKGVDLEIFEGYCQARGCTLKITAYDWQGMLGAVSSGQADVAFSGISITDKRKQAMDFSQPYYDNAWHLVTLTSRDLKFDGLEDLKQYSLGYPRGMAYADLIKSDLEPKGLYELSRAQLYPSYNEVVADMQSGNLDVAFIEQFVLNNFQYKLQLPLESRYAFTGIDTLGFAFAKGSPLRDDFDAYLTELGPEKVKEIIDRWEK